MTDDKPVKRSPLCQTIERDGHSIVVEIYDNGEGGWILEAIDVFNNSTVWEDPFKTDKEALAELLDTIDKEGIQILIASESWQSD